MRGVEKKRIEIKKLNNRSHLIILAVIVILMK